jgi:hypothetical protein
MAVTRLEIQHRGTVLDGAPFGETGAYEKIAGTIHFAHDPAHPRHRDITDIGLAPRNAHERVESSADFYLLRPVDPSWAKRCLLLDVPNRGRKVALGMFNSTARSPDPTTHEDFGNGFLLRQGYTIAWCGWQHDVPRRDGLMAMTVPAAAAVNGLVRCQLRPNVPTDVLPLADRYHHPYPAADVEDASARLTVRAHGGAPIEVVPRTAWRFARRDGERLVSDPRHLHLSSGFVPGHIYEFVYRSENPPLVGLGLLAVPDVAAWLRYASAADGNPCAGELERSYVFGVSQSGRFLRHMLYLGLTEDETGRPAFDAVIPHVAGGRRGEFNLRFGQPSLNATRSVGSLFPFNAGMQVDSITGARDGLLARLQARGRIPKVVLTNSSAEYWRGDASLIHTDVKAQHDVEQPAGVRVYLLAGTQHTPGALPPLDADPNTGSRGLQKFNVVDYAPLLRAVLVNLDRWVRDGIAPPPSAVPRIAEGTAARAESTAAAFRRIPGVRFPDRLVRPARLDFGPDIERGIANKLPPDAGEEFPTLVAAIDEDGNEIAGIRPPELLSPLATFTGWNPRHPDQGAPGDLMQMMGSTLPFARTRAERERSGDPRLSIEERYASREAYLDHVRASVKALVAARHVLAEDTEVIVERAAKRYDLIHQGL